MLSVPQAQRIVDPKTSMAQLPQKERQEIPEHQLAATVTDIFSLGEVRFARHRTHISRCTLIV